MAKWQLVLKSLPIAIAVLVLRYFAQGIPALKGAVSFGDAGSVLTGAALIIGLMLGGVIGDYREAEKLPAAIGGGLLGLEAYAKRALQLVDKDNSWVHGRLATVAHAVNEWLYGRMDTASMWAAYDEVNKVCDEVAKQGATIPYVNQLHAANNGLGGAIDRVDGIRTTSYIKSGYALMEFLVGIVLVLMVVCSFDNEAANWLVPGAISMVYVFMVLFIKDLDNPFGWGENGGKGSAADVDSGYWDNVYRAYQ
jgi:hypothetical protein